MNSKRLLEQILPIKNVYRKIQEKAQVEHYNYLILRVNQEIDEMPVYPTDETTKKILKLERLREIIVDQRDAWIFDNKET